MEFKNLKIAVNNRVAIIHIACPPANALNSDTLSSLSDCLDYVENEPGIKSIIITGEGNFFVAGADIKEFTPLFGDPENAKKLSKVGQRLFDRIEGFRKPVIAAINGACLGGGFELALSCHLRIASEQALLGLPEMKLGLIPGFGGTQRLARMTNKGKALELLLTSRFIDGREAERLGIVNYATAPQKLLEEAVKLAEEIASTKGAVSVSAALKAVSQGLENSLEEGLALEAELFGQLFVTEDAREGVSAFLEKRQAGFKDK